MQLSPIAPIGTALITVLIGLIGFTQRRSLLSKLFAIDVAAIGIVTLFIWWPPELALHRRSLWPLNIQLP